MENLLKARKNNNSLMKLRKDEIKYKLNTKKSNDDNNNQETFTKLYEEHNKRRMNFSWGITKKSVEIISTKNLNIYNEYGQEDEKLNPNNNIKKNEQYKTNKNNNIQSKNMSKRNLQKIKKEKENIDNLLITHIDNLKKNDDNSENNLDENKKNTLFKAEDNTFKRINNKKLKSFKKQKTKNNINIINEEYEEYINGEFNINIFYEGKGQSIKISKEEKFSKCLSSIEKLLFPFHKLNEFDILYKLKSLDINSIKNEKLSDIIDEKNNTATFYLKKKNHNNINNTTVLIENFPSFTDLATELNKFFEKEKRESYFTVDYKGNVCKVSFSESEKAFSLIVFLTKLKKVNPIFKRLKINMDYKLNVVLDVKKLRQKPIKLFLPLINKKSCTIKKDIKKFYNKKLIKINTEKNIINYKSRNDNKINNNNLYFNSMENKTIFKNKTKNKKRYESCLTLGENSIMNNIKSKIIKNKNNDSPIENNFKSNKEIKSRNFLPNYVTMSKSNKNNNIIRKDLNESLSLSEKSEEIEHKPTKLKSTNFIIDLRKSKKKTTNIKNYVNSDDEKSLSPRNKPIKKSNFYNLFMKNLSKNNMD